jgi:extradiol dioxygenase family protein
VRPPDNAFHLAIPSHDLGAAYRFYVEGLGCHLARSYEDRITLDFFGDQLVCHLHDAFADPTPDAELDLYPRHFGITFHDRTEFDAVARLIELRKLPVFREVTTRFAGTVEEHTTVVLLDPSQNLLEFKHYVDPRMMH